MQMRWKNEGKYKKRENLGRKIKGEEKRRKLGEDINKQEKEIENHRENKD